MKNLLRIIAGIGVVTLIFGTPAAYAIFGIRAARTVIAARKAKQAASSSSSASEEAYAQEKAKFDREAGNGRATKSGNNEDSVLFEGRPGRS